MIRLFYNNGFDTMGLEFSSEQEQFPASNLQHTWKTKRWRSTSVLNQYVRTIGGASQLAAGFFLLNGNITEAATVRVKGSNDGWATAPLNELMKRGSDGNYVYMPANTLSYNDYGVSIHDPGNLSGYVSAGRFWYSTYWEPRYGFMPHAPAAVVKEIFTTQSSGGQISRISYREPFKKWPGLKFSAETDIDSYSEYTDYAYKQAHFAVFQPKGFAGVTYPDYEDNTFYVRLDNYNEENVACSVFSFTIDLVEEQ